MSWLFYCSVFENQGGTWCRNPWAAFSSPVEGRWISQDYCSGRSLLSSVWSLGAFSEEIPCYLLITSPPLYRFPSWVGVDAYKANPALICCAWCGCPCVWHLWEGKAGFGDIASVFVLYFSPPPKGVVTAGIMKAGDLLCWSHTGAEHPMLSLVPAAAVKTEQDAQHHSRSDPLGIFSEHILHKDCRVSHSLPARRAPYPAT